MASSAPKRVAISSPRPTLRERFIGSLIYKCGLDLTLVNELQQANRQRLDEVPSFLTQTGRALSFETQRGQWVVAGDRDSAEVHVCVLSVDESPAAASKFLEENSLDTASRVLVVLDDMEKSDWSITSFQAFQDVVGSRFQLIPASSALGDNMLEPSDRLQWSSDRQIPSVIQALNNA